MAQMRISDAPSEEPVDDELLLLDDTQALVCLWWSIVTFLLMSKKSNAFNIRSIFSVPQNTSHWLLPRAVRILRC